MNFFFGSVDLKFPKIEVRFQNLMVESFVHVGSRALPTIPNFIINMAEVLTTIDSFFLLSCCELIVVIKKSFVTGFVEEHSCDWWKKKQINDFRWYQWDY